MADESIRDSLARCGSIISPEERLACFDDLVEQATPTREEPAGTAATAETRSTGPTAQDQENTSRPETEFGKEHWSTSGERAPSLESQILRVQKAAHGQLVLTLANGQVWRQRDARQFPVTVGDTVVIERAALNSFFLKRQDGSRAERFYRVE